VLADAAIRVIARTGLRGLTHRAVDAEAGVPEGSTSYYFRTRQALLSAALARLADLDRAVMLAHPEAVATTRADRHADLSDVAHVAGGRLDLDQLAETIARVLGSLLDDRREQALARFELTLEATRRPELREALESVGSRFREAATSLLAAAGSSDPERHGHQLVVYLDGLLLSQLTAGSSGALTPERLRLGVRDLLRGMLER
jgi:DNA-binding transcriptional regulator YbjK